MKRFVLTFFACIWLCTVIVSSSSVTSVRGGKISGSCGDNMTWAYDEVSSLLIISGFGEMKTFSYSNVPWTRFLSDIFYIDFVGNITSISQYAFMGCTYLESVTIPQSVTRIGMFAFQDCVSLTSIELPNNLKVLDTESLYNCAKLTSLSIPSTLQEWGTGVTASCSSLKEINVADDNPYFVSVDGILFNKGRTTIYQFPAGKDTKHYKVPDNVTYVQNHCFSGCVNLESVELPNALTSVPNGAFCGCKNLKSVNIPDHATSIDSAAFSQCSSLKSIVIPESVKYFRDDAFKECTSLDTVVYEGKYDPYFSYYIFYKCPLTYVCVPLDYNSSSFCGISVGKSSSCIAGNQCYKSSYDGDEWHEEQRGDAIEWENRMSGCVSFYCDNTYGLLTRSKCKDTEMCTDDKCGVISEEPQWTVNINIESFEYSLLDVTGFVNETCVLTSLQANELKISVKIDERGLISSIIVYVNDEDKANTIVSSMTSMKEGKRCEQQQTSTQYQHLCPVLSSTSSIHIGIKPNEQILARSAITQLLSILVLLLTLLTSITPSLH